MSKYERLLSEFAELLLEKCVLISACDVKSVNKRLDAIENEQRKKKI